MLDHMGFAVKDYDRSKTFYEQALIPLGLSVLKDFPGAAAGFGKDGHAASRMSWIPTATTSRPCATHPAVSHRDRGTAGRPRCDQPHLV